MSCESCVSYADLRSHFKLYSSANEQEETTILNNCINLFKKDYSVHIIENQDFCPTYPKKLIIPYDSTGINSSSDTLEKLFDGSRYARLRSRFPIPVACFNGRNICRSATLAQKAECVAKAAKNGFSIQGALCWISGPRNNSAESVLDNSRNDDINLIKYLQIRYICDLMVEDKKKKYGIYVSSSEKTDRLARYAGFCISAVPYPGTEFFAEWKEHDYGLTEVDWSVHGTDTTSVILDPDAPMPFRTESWKSWDIIELTSKYLQLILSYLSAPEAGGVLIHCISGWDRTPLYVSLVRLSLWADGEIHRNLTALEILYLTVNYDWFLFHHYLYDRCSRGEDVFYFCFYFLSYIIDDEFSVTAIAEKTRQQVHSASQKISIRPEDEGSDEFGSYSSSFGSCGRSWEMTSGYMSQYGKTKSCLFMDEKDLKVVSDQSISEVTPSAVDDNSEDVDALFSFDDGEEEEFCVLSRTSCDGLPDNSEDKRSVPHSARAAKLLEVREMMLQLYSSFIGGTL